MTSRESEVSFFKAHHHDGHGQACPQCKGSGYKGQIGVYEVLRMNDELATAVFSGATTDVIRQKVLPNMALNMLTIGEETGEMDRMLSKVADFYEDKVGAMVKALTSMLEPAMIVLVGGIVGSILLAMYLPMFTMFDQIQ